jgi:hypothetical protein
LVVWDFAIWHGTHSYFLLYKLRKVDFFSFSFNLWQYLTFKRYLFAIHSNFPLKQEILLLHIQLSSYFRNNYNIFTFLYCKKISIKFMLSSKWV